MIPEVLVLAGGHSTRMGEDKALVEVRSVPMLSRVCRVARLALGPQTSLFIVTPWPERYIALDLHGAGFVREAQAGSGPLTGLLRGLEAISATSREEWILVLACDLPCLQAAVLRGWVHRLAEVPETAVACLLRSNTAERAWEPLCGFYRWNCRQSLGAYLQNGGRSLMGWLSGIEVAALPEGSEGTLLNCNTRADVLRAEAMLEF